MAKTTRDQLDNPDRVRYPDSEPTLHWEGAVRWPCPMAARITDQQDGKRNIRKELDRPHGASEDFERNIKCIAEGKREARGIPEGTLLEEKTLCIS